MTPPDGDAIEPVTGVPPVRAVGPAYRPGSRAGAAAQPAADGDAGVPVLAAGGLVPAAGPAFPLALLLAALRRDGRSWLGPGRLRHIAADLHLSESRLLALIDAPPCPPPALGDPLSWTGQRVPLRYAGAVIWAELFWRPDRGVRRRHNGGFAASLVLPATGRIEIRGRIEADRLDTVAEIEQALPCPLAADLAEFYEGVVQRLGMTGALTLRNTIT